MGTVNYGAEDRRVNIPRNFPPEILDSINSKGPINLNNGYGTNCYFTEVRRPSCY